MERRLRNRFQIYRRLNKTLDKPIDLAAFEKGELVVLSAMTDDEGNLLIQPGQAITVVGESGEQVFTVALAFWTLIFRVVEEMREVLPLICISVSRQ